MEVRAADRVPIWYCGNILQVDAVPFEGSKLVPIRFFEMLGAMVEWLGPEEGISITLNGRCLRLQRDRAPRLLVGGYASDLVWKIQPRVYNDTVYVPLRPAAEALGLTVVWRDDMACLD